MNFPLKLAVKGKGNETLDKNSYIAAGGFGTVCQKGGVAYKIYHDPKHMIPVKKIEELQILSKHSNVLGPHDILLDPKTSAPVGFTMTYVPNTEFLCRLFSKSFRQDNNISPQMVVDLVRSMQITVSDIHKERILIVDLNEMNFLTDGTYTTPYFIDVDSYQTPSFRATALMENVRDRQGPKGQFTENTDWFSFAVVSFQLYMGYHPYSKGKHPSYAPKDWSLRMDNNISVFHPEVTVADVWKDFSVIPNPHLEWYKRVFHNMERSAPPLPEGAILVGVMQPLMIAGNDKFEVKKLFGYNEKILGHYFFNGFSYVLTEKGVYSGVPPLRTFTKKYRKMSLAQVVGKDPILAYHEGNTLCFEDMKGNHVGRLAATDAMQHNGCIYSIYNGKMTESMFQFFGIKVVQTTKDVSNIFEPATKLYPGVAVQDILGKCWLAIPYSQGRCSNIPIPALDGERIIDAKFEWRVCILISEKGGKYKRTILCFDEQVVNYTTRVEDDIPYEGVNFTCLSNGICVHIPTDDRVEVFKGNSTVKTVPNPPFTPEMKLANDSTGVLFLKDNEIYSVKLK
jgi:serine/threonine protein kinase